MSADDPRPPTPDDPTPGPTTPDGSARPRTEPVAGAASTTQQGDRYRRARHGGPTTTPRGLWVGAGVGLALLLGPLLALVVRAPWRRVGDIATDPVLRSALVLSLVAPAVATVVIVVVGFPLAWVLARVDFPGRRLVRALVLLPMVLPPVVGGVALLLAFGRRGLAGGWLERVAGIVLPFTTAGVVLAAVFVALPFFVVTVEAALASVDPRHELAAASVGATPWRVLARVTVPLVRPAMTAGAALAWARALGEFGATITFAGNLPGTTQTLPLAVYVQLQRDPGAATLLSLVLLAVSVVVLVALRARWLTPLTGGTS